MAIDVAAPEYIDWVHKRFLPNPFSGSSGRLSGRFTSHFFNHFFTHLPSQCAVCRTWPAAPVCGDCMARFAAYVPRCQTCAIALPAGLALRNKHDEGATFKCIVCIKAAPPLDAAYAALDYTYPWSTLISRYKFGQQPGWAPFFSALMLQTPGASQSLASLQADDLIIPVPLSKERLQTRGFNQAWELARLLAQQSASLATADSKLLLRVKNTRPQTELLRQERLANVKGAFQLDPLRALEVKGKRVVLVDDVMTSGASLFTAAQALRAAGAAHITGLVLARTPQ